MSVCKRLKKGRDPNHARGQPASFLKRDYEESFSSFVSILSWNPYLSHLLLLRTNQSRHGKNWKCLSTQQVHGRSGGRGWRGRKQAQIALIIFVQIVSVVVVFVRGPSMQLLLEALHKKVRLGAPPRGYALSGAVPVRQVRRRVHRQATTGIE